MMPCANCDDTGRVYVSGPCDAPRTVQCPCRKCDLCGYIVPFDEELLWSDDGDQFCCWECVHQYYQAGLERELQKNREATEWLQLYAESYASIGGSREFASGIRMALRVLRDGPPKTREAS